LEACGVINIASSHYVYQCGMALESSKASDLISPATIKIEKNSRLMLPSRDRLTEHISRLWSPWFSKTM